MLFSITGAAIFFGIRKSVLDNSALRQNSARISQDNMGGGGDGYRAVAYFVNWSV
jgi:hypothetical protein